MRNGKRDSPKSASMNGWVCEKSRKANKQSEKIKVWMIRRFHFHILFRFICRFSQNYYLKSFISPDTLFGFFVYCRKHFFHAYRSYGFSAPADRAANFFYCRFIWIDARKVFRVNLWLNLKTPDPWLNGQLRVESSARLCAGTLTLIVLSGFRVSPRIFVSSHGHKRQIWSSHSALCVDS